MRIKPVESVYMVTRYDLRKKFMEQSIQEIKEVQQHQKDFKSTGQYIDIKV